MSIWEYIAIMNDCVSVVHLKIEVSISVYKFQTRHQNCQRNGGICHVRQYFTSVTNASKNA